MEFDFKPVDAAHRITVHRWIKLPHAAQWFYGQGLQNTIDHLDLFVQGKANASYWLAYDGKRPFAFLITSNVKPSDPISRYCQSKGAAITLDVLIGEADYLGKGLAILLIHSLLLKKFPNTKEVLIDPEKTNERAIHVYRKAGFEILEEFIPSHSPHPHLMMRLDMRKLVS